MNDERLNPPDAKTLAYRALCLGALITRAELETAFRDNPGPGIDESLKRMIDSVGDWLAGTGLGRQLSDEEGRLLAKPAGSWSEEEASEAAWRTEALSALLWALGVAEAAPRYDAEFADAKALERLGLMKPIDGFLRRAGLRPPEEIAREREVAALWDLRAKIERIVREMPEVQPPGGQTFPEVVVLMVRQAYAEGLIAQTVEDDLPAFGKPYRQLSEEELRRATNIASERLHALNWLRSQAEDWDATPADA